MTDDLISRQRAIDALEKCREHCCREDEVGDKWVHYETALNEIESIPPTQPTTSDCLGCNCPKMERLCGQSEHIKGRWIYTGVKFPNWEGQVISEAFCSECNGISYFRRAFDKYIGANICPNCGADMRGKQDD